MSQKRGLILPLITVVAALAVGLTLGRWSLQSPADPAPGAGVRTATGAAAAPAAGSVSRVRLELAGAPVVGPEDAPVTIVEFVDYQCPFCVRAHETVKAVQRAYPDKVRLVFLQNPLDFHADAPLASRATLAAAEQGRFLEMHDLVLTRGKVSRQALVEYARQLDLDMAAWQTAMDSPRLQARVAADKAQAGRVGASATPFFFVNGRPVRGAQPYATFDALIQEELNGSAGPTRWVARAEAPPAPPRPPAEDPNRVYRIDTAGSVALGPEDAPVTVVEFTDFQCGFCARSQSTLLQVMETWPEEVRVVVKNLPLSFHRQAEPAAVASLAAARQGRYWDYRPLLFANQQALTPDRLRAYAEEIGLDMDRFDADMQDPDLVAVVRRDVRQAQTVGVTGTPTFFINGRKLSGAQPFERFRSVIEAQLARAG